MDHASAFINNLLSKHKFIAISTRSKERLVLSPFSKEIQMRLSARFVIRHQHILHILRVVIACTIALLIIRIFNFPHSSWAEITIIVVMGPVSYMGTVLTKANQRLCGTLIGASLAFLYFYYPITVCFYTIFYY